MLQGDRKRYDLAGKIYINEEGGTVGALVSALINL
jgi:hypothetical protein